MNKLSKNPNQQRIKNFLTLTNAFAKNLQESGEKTEFLNAVNAKEVYTDLLKTCMYVSDSTHEKHSNAVAFIKNSFPSAQREAVEKFAEIGEGLRSKVQEIATVYAKNGIGVEKAVAGAFNSIAGNPVYDHFGNLALLSVQLMEEMTFIQSFIDNGDAFNMPIENGGDGTSMSRFRSPSEEVSGSPKTMQGDINPTGEILIDGNRINVNLYNEFKNVKWITQPVSLTSSQRDQFLMYENAVRPALAGFLIQQRLLDNASKFIMKEAEVNFVGGLDQRNNFVPGVGGSYGLLSDNVILNLADWNTASPQPAGSADWKANPTKLIQKIQNFYYKPTSVSAPLPILDTANMYKDIVRLLALPAKANVNLEPKTWTLYVPTTWYSIATQYPTGGTFNKQLQEMIDTAISGSIVKNIEVKTSSLLNYGADIGTRTNPYNYMILVASGSPTEKKAVILPGQTTIPSVIALPSSTALMNFNIQYATGGAMVKQYGGCFVLEFSAPA